MLKKIKDLHFDLVQLIYEIWGDLDIDSYQEGYPAYYDHIESYDGEWSVEIIETIEGYDDFILFKELGDSTLHHCDNDYGNSIHIRRGKKYTYFQNEDKQWLVCVNENEVV